MAEHAARGAVMIFRFFDKQLFNKSNCLTLFLKEYQERAMKTLSTKLRKVDYESLKGLGDEKRNQSS